MPIKSGSIFTQKFVSFPIFSGKDHKPGIEIATDVLTLATGSDLRGMPQSPGRAQIHVDYSS
jgi:hypothetical protein